MSSENSRRWRLVLGRYSDNRLAGLSGQDARADKALDYLYAREYQKRGASFGQAPGSLDPTQMNAIKWLGEAQRRIKNTEALRHGELFLLLHLT